MSFDQFLLSADTTDLNYPEIRPTLDLNFARVKALDPRITFTRASGGSYVGADGLIKYAGVNEARFDHDPETGESLGLLIEEQRSNLQLNSGDPTQWIISNMIPTGNSILRPDGIVSTTVEYRGETEDGNAKLIRPTPTGGIVARETFTFSIFLRYGTEETVHVVLQDNVAGQSTGRTFNLLNGDWTNLQGFSGGTSGNSGFDRYLNGWYRVWLSCTFPNSASGIQTFVRLRGNLGSVPLTTSFSAWGAQFEKASYPTSYIPTTASTVTRTVDDAFIGGNEFQKFFNPLEGAMLANLSIPRDNGLRPLSTPGIFGFSRNEIEKSTNDGYAITMRSDTRLFSASHRVTDDPINLNVSNVGPITSSTVQPNILYKVGLMYSNNELGLIIGNTNHINSIADSNYGLYPKTTLFIGRSRIGGSPPFQLSGHIRQLTYYPKRLPNPQLAALTR
jgi:hypothetical protein